MGRNAKNNAARLGVASLAKKQQTTGVQRLRNRGKVISLSCRTFFFFHQKPGSVISISGRLTQKNGNAFCRSGAPGEKTAQVKIFPVFSFISFFSTSCRKMHAQKTMSTFSFTFFCSQFIKSSSIH